MKKLSQVPTGMHNMARSISTNQLDVHEDLLTLVHKHQRNHSQKPFAEHTKMAFQIMLDWLQDWHGEVIIDACCGVGESTARLALAYPNCRIVGVDKSAARLSKQSHYQKLVHKDSAQNIEEGLTNHINIQADLNDFWRLLEQHVAEHPWRIGKQYLLYPNPYPKKTQLQKRWHASSAMKSIVACSSVIEVRSNWLIYLQEFQKALACYDISSNIACVESEPFTPFERKYLASEQVCWQLNTNQ